MTLWARQRWAGRLDPDYFQEFIRRFLDACQSEEVISRFDGLYCKYKGDGTVSVFWYPTPHEHDAARAAPSPDLPSDLASRPFLANISPTGFNIAARIWGITTGFTVQLRENSCDKICTRSGCSVKLPISASRLQGLSAPNQLLVDSATKRLVGDEFEFADQGTISCQGFAMPAQVGKFWAASLRASRFESYRSGRLTQFIGREHETALLVGRWPEAVEGEGKPPFSVVIGRDRQVSNCP